MKVEHIETTGDLKLAELPELVQTLIEFDYLGNPDRGLLEWQMIRLDGQFYILAEDDTALNLDITECKETSAVIEDLAPIHWNHTPMEILKIIDPDYYTEIVEQALDYYFDN